MSWQRNYSTMLLRYIHINSKLCISYSDIVAGTTGLV